MPFLTFSPQKAGACARSDPSRLQVHESVITVLDTNNVSTASSPHMAHRQPEPHDIETETAVQLRRRVHILSSRELSNAELVAVNVAAVHCVNLIFPRLDLALLRPQTSCLWTADEARSSPKSGTTAGSSESALDCAARLNDEELLFVLRYCVARNFVTGQVQRMVDNMLQFRQERQVERIIRNTGTSDMRRLLKQFYPSNYYGITRSGLPIYLDRPGYINAKSLANVAESDLEAVWIQSYEHKWR
eukprot:Gregarina_sp_Poly_1__3695@NODE_2091_length_2701_cov_87_752468_g902_i1_p2_GENE_NODE_2091_length_2701_cov_87_752468_g902_i1NODE_2091_length_2701_cov_87_752468_g902_i1_p2_ORF_typecomplete_len246_score27_56_NODE_2091_length_2701_cov_87_752468_g902_i117922529